MKRSLITASLTFADFLDASDVRREFQKGAATTLASGKAKP